MAAAAQTMSTCLSVYYSAHHPERALPVTEYRDIRPYVSVSVVLRTCMPCIAQESVVIHGTIRSMFKHVVA
jgi:hypothetical protein